jgi:hypothetical protein
VQKTPLGRLLARLRPGGQPDFLGDPETQPMPRQPAPSRAGAALIARADLDWVARARRANAGALLSAIGARAAWTPLFPSRNDVAPYRLVMRCASQDEASRLYLRLRTAGVPVESWPDLPPEVGEGAARRLRRTLLLLPVHQDLSPKALTRACLAALEGA